MLYWPVYKKSMRQKVHELLRQDPTLSVEQITQRTGVPWGFARVWKKNFFSQ